MGEITPPLVETGYNNNRGSNHYIRSEKTNNWTTNSFGNQVKIPKILFPSFEVSNPINWIMKCKRYLNINPMTDKQKLDMVSLHVEGRADT